ncbi:MAG: amino acid dehydrogenase [Gammaproteobacteria bacterium]|nr:amino acid dehydrogenase [Gammaproteobacteria bacterium]
MNELNNIPVLDRVREHTLRDTQNLDANLAWLQKEMHHYFFRFNSDDVEAMTMLVGNLHRMNQYRRINLVEREERLMVAQAGSPESLYETLSGLRERNISYAEINTSYSPIPATSNKLEVLRFDYDRKNDCDFVDNGKAVVPREVYDAVERVIAADYPGFDEKSTQRLLNMFWLNNQDYIQVSPPERVARIMNLYARTNSCDGVYLDLQTLQNPGGSREYRLLFGMVNPPQKGFILQIIEAFNRLGIGVDRAYCLTVTDSVQPCFLSTFYVKPPADVRLEKGSELFQQLKLELYNTQILSSRSQSYDLLVKPGLTSGFDATLIEAMIGFCYTNLAHNCPDSFELEGIMRAFHNHPGISLQLVKLFHARFEPEQKDRDSFYTETLHETVRLVENYNTGRRFLDSFRRTIFRSAISFVRHCLKTNFFVTDKHALAFRMDPGYLDDLGEKFTSDLPADRPFRITFFLGRNGLGYHIGFSDIARGGWRTLITQGRDDYITSANTLFRENYVLAHTQHLKNKDIYEGGSKMVAILNAEPDTGEDFVRQYLYKLQFGFINAFLDLFVTRGGKAADPRVVDYYGQEEAIELGPDENMHDEMVERIAVQAGKRDYVLGAGIISSKSAGINHKEYGVTSIGVVRFSEVTMQALGIDMHKDPFTAKFTGGPNGDVAGNAMKLLLKRCPGVKIKLIVDGTGALYDPLGLDSAALSRIILQGDLEDYDTAALNPGGFILYRRHTRKKGMLELYRKIVKTEEGQEELWMSNDDFFKAYNSLPFTVATDLFIPAGGRPETIDSSNFQLFFDQKGRPSAKVIIEGANSFFTPDARTELQKRGVVIMRDASANKCGVISSSYEILANLMFSASEFLAYKERYVGNVIEILNQMAEKEAFAILKRHQDAAGAVSYTEISDQISRDINIHYARFFDFFEANPELTDKPRYRNAILHHMPRILREDSEFHGRIDRLPTKVKSAVLASTLASSMVYTGDDSSVFADIVEAQLTRFPDYSQLRIERSSMG